MTTSDDAAQRWVAAKAVFAAALEQPTAEREEYVAAACEQDAALRDEVSSLLAAHVEDSDFLSDHARDRLRATVAHHIGLAVGARVGAYRVLGEIARGGMGTVYLAERADAEFEQRVAIKLVTRGMDTELVLRRFRQERQILAGLHHPNIARLLDGGTTEEGLPFFVMEYIDGEPIDRYCVTRALSTDRRLELFLAVCAAVQYAHQRLVIHRDIKPGNILVTADGTPKLLDFGIAKLLTEDGDGDLTAPHFRALTPDYASPEQLDGALVTTLADVYSLGVVLHRMLTNAAPRRDAREITGEIPGLRGDIASIVQTALRREPERRYASVQALSDDIGRFRRGLAIAARPDSLAYRLSTFARRNRSTVALGALAVLALLGGSAAFAWQAHVATAQRAVAERHSATVRRLALSLLFDVHDSIASLPGSTRARQLIVTRSLESLDTLAEDDPNDPLLQRDIAVAYLRVGNVQGQPYSANLGRTSDAAKSFARAAALLEPIVAANPRDTLAQHALASAFMRTSGVELRAGNAPAAVVAARRAIAAIENGLGAVPGDVDGRASLSYAFMYLGDALAAGDDGRSLARVQAAGDAYQHSLMLERDMLTRLGRAPARLRTLGQAYTRLAYVASWTADITGDTAARMRAVVNHRMASALRAEIVGANPTVAERRNAADAQMDVANAEMAAGRPQAALAQLDSAGPVFATLAHADAANVEARRDLAYYDENRGVVLFALGRIAEAGEQERAAIALLAQLQRDDPSSAEEYYHLVHADEVLGDAAMRRGDSGSATAAYRAALSALEQWKRTAPSAKQPARLEQEIVARTATLGSGTKERRRLR